MPMKKLPKYWYKFFEDSCPVCGSREGKFDRVRQYSPKPENPQDRHEFRHSYDWCLE